MKQFLTLLFLTLTVKSAFADTSVTLTVDTEKKEEVNHMLLGLNCNWPESLYGKIGYSHPDAQKLITQFKPSSLRFPHGVWANFYDWESDGRRMTDNYKTAYDSAVKDHPDLKYGFEGFHKLHDALRFDVLFTYNVNYDSPEKAVRRLKDRQAKGFNVKWIELGNEPFWKTQRSEAVSTMEKYIDVSRAHAKALRAVDPNIKISVPLHWRDALTNEWNQPFKSLDYFDAITIHKHITKPDTPEGVTEALAARQEVVAMGKELRTAFPNKPIWVSEWSVHCANEAVCILGMADIFLGLFENQDIFEIADYFQINASQALIRYDKKTGTHTRTGYGAAYEIIRNIFEKSERFETNIDSEKVSASAALKDGKLIIFAINKSNQPANLKLNFSDNTYPQPAKHSTLELTNLKPFTLDENVLTEIPTADSIITLPPMSLNRIE